MTNLANNLISINNNYWDFGIEKESKMHRIHAYPAKFPAFITTKAIEYAKNEGVNISTVADIFCGCGTTSLEAKKKGIDFWGCDINPVATLIAKTKSKLYNPEKLEIYKNEILKYYKGKKNKKFIYTKINPRINYWFYDKEIIDLLRLKESILNTIPPNSFYRYFFLCAFSNILKSTSKWLTKSIKPQIDQDKTPADVITSFISQYNFMFIANLENEVVGNAKSNIIADNILDCPFEESFVDLLITSPPYVTSYEYADLHQLSTLWLDFADDYRKLRNGTIGSIYHQNDYFLDSNLVLKPGKSIVEELLLIDKRKAKAIYKYFIDMQKVINISYSLINPDGMALYVIGNTEYKGIQILNSIHLKSALNRAGFNDIKEFKRKISNKNLTPYRDSKGRFTTDNSQRKVYAEEFVIIGRK